MCKIALDVDDVLAAFTPHAHTFFNKEMEKCDYWCETTMNGKFGEKWFNEHIAGNDDFWNTLPVLSPPEDINFEFDYYISAFPQEKYQLRVDWLKRHGYPDKPLILTYFKYLKCVELDVDVLVDDKPAMIESLQGTRIKGVHFITPYAGFKPVGDHVITNLKQLKDHI